MMHQSIATIDSPEFINLQPLEINPLMSSCEIKVLYLGENRNHSYITKEVATEMAKTLRGAPIVGYYREEKQDFADHGERIIFDDEGIKFECMTVPYGFVSPDAKVWFQKFDDVDDFGNSVTREYLMTTGYLWTGQYEECKSVVEGGKPQSMELDEESLEGRWSTNSNTGMDFFIINDAIFSKLCILGEDVEPCFEGSNITAPEVSKTFSKMDDNFKNTLFTMMQDLKFALEGGQNMKVEETIMTEETEVVTEVQEEVEVTPAVEEEISTDKVNEEQSDMAENEDSIEDQTSNENFTAEEESSEVVETKFEESEEEGDSSESTETEDTENSEEPTTEENEDEEGSEEDTEEKLEDDADDEESKKKLDYSLEYEELQVKYEELKTKYEELVAFKNQIDDEKKTALIDSFYMLSDEDKQDVISNKSNYSLEEIEAKLSVICFRKKINFDLDENETSKEEKTTPVVTYNLSVESETSVPAWIAAVKNTRDNK